MYTCVWGRRKGRPSSEIESRKVQASGATYMNYVHSLSLRNSQSNREKGHGVFGLQDTETHSEVEG